jgi:DNA-binding FrmR family transcriptional regulator
MDAAIDGPKAIEKLPDYANKYVVVVEATGQDLDGTQLAASKINAQTAISGLISTRVKDTFAGSQVGDKDKIENYMERVVKSVSEATFSGFAKETDWWVKQQTFTSDGKPDKQVYRVTQLWTIDKDVLKKQLTNQMSGAAAAEPKTEDKQKAIDLVQQSFFDGF